MPHAANNILFFFYERVEVKWQVCWVGLAIGNAVVFMK